MEIALILAFFSFLTVTLCAVSLQVNSEQCQHQLAPSGPNRIFQVETSHPHGDGERVNTAAVQSAQTFEVKWIYLLMFICKMFIFHLIEQCLEWIRLENTIILSDGTQSSLNTG